MAKEHYLRRPHLSVWNKEKGKGGSTNAQLCQWWVAIKAREPNNGFMSSGSYWWAREGRTGKVDANCRDYSVSPAAGSGNRASIMNWGKATKAFLPGSEWSPAVLAGAVCVGDWHGEWAFFIGNSVVWTVSLWGKPHIPELGRAKNTAEKAISEREKCKQLTECYGLNRNVRVLKWVSEKTESCNLKWWISHCQLSQNVREACVSREEAGLHS